MSRRYAVAFTDEAWAEVDAHARHIAVTLRSPLNAARWLSRLFDAVDSLEEFPTRFSIDDRQSARVGATVHRLTFERTCVLLYSVNDPSNTVLIHSFRHGGYD